jgi:hypothetical protein
MFAMIRERGMGKMVGFFLWGGEVADDKKFKAAKGLLKTEEGREIFTRMLGDAVYEALGNKGLREVILAYAEVMGIIEDKKGSDSDLREANAKFDSAVQACLGSQG